MSTLKLVIQIQPRRPTLVRLWLFTLTPYPLNTLHCIILWTDNRRIVVLFPEIKEFSLTDPVQRSNFVSIGEIGLSNVAVS